MMESSDHIWLIQVQHNRLIVNWRHQPGSVYPGVFAEAGVYERFQEVLESLEQLMGQQVRPTRVEVTKVNALEQGTHWRDAEDLVTLIPAFQGLRAALPGPELHFNVSINDHGKLPQHILSARTLRRQDGGLLVHLELSARCAYDGTAPLHESFHQANQAVNDRFFSIIPESQRSRFGGERL